MNAGSRAPPRRKPSASTPEAERLHAGSRARRLIVKSGAVRWQRSRGRRIFAEVEGFLPLEPPAAEMAEATLRSDYRPRQVGPITPPSWPARGAWLGYRSRSRRSPGGGRSPGSRRSPGGGRLWISPDGVSFAQESREAPIRFVHTADIVVMTASRLRPPWANTFLFLRCGNRRLRVGVSGLARRSIRRALQDAGLTVRESAYWTAPASAAAAGRRARHRGRR